MSNTTNYQIAFQLGASMNSSMRTAFANTNRNLSDMSRNTSDANRQTGKLSKSLGALSKVAAAAGVALAGAMTVKFGKDAVNTFATFEQSMANVKAVSGVAGEEFDMLAEKAKQMGATTSKTAAEAADGLQYLALAGWDTQQMIAGIEPVLRLSEAGALDLGRASDLVTDSMSALGVEVQDLPGYLDQVAQTSRRANTNIDALMEAFLVSGGTFKTFNIPLEEANALLGIMANRGYKGSQAGTAMNAIVTNLTSGAGAAGKAMNELGISAFDNQGKFKGLENVFLEVKSKLDVMTDAQKAQYISMIAGKEHLKTFTGIMDGLGNEYNDLKSEISGADGALQDMADTQMDTYLGAMKLLESAIDGVKLAVGERLAPSIRRVAEFITTNMSTVQSVIEKFMDRTGNALGTMKNISRNFIKYLPNLNQVRRTFSKIIETVTSIIGKLKPAFQTILNIIMPILFDAATFIKGIWSQILRFWNENGAQIIQAVKNVFSFISKIVKVLAPVVLFILTSVWTNVKGVIQGALNIILGLVKVFASLFTGDWTGVWEGVKKILGGAVQFLWNLWNLLLVGKLVGSIKGIAKAFWSFLKGLGQRVSTNVQYYYHLFVQGFYKIATGIFKAIGKGFMNIVGVVKNSISTFINVFRMARTFGVNIFMSIVSAVRNVFSTIFGAVRNSVSNVINTVKGYLGNLWTDVVSIFTKIKTAITNPFTTLKGIVKTAIDAVKGLVSGLFDGVKISGKSAINGVIMAVNAMINGINGISVKVPDWVPEYGGRTIGFSLPKIPMLAAGGITTGATLAMIGEGQEQEAILPLSKLESLLNTPPNSTTNVNNDQPIQIVYSPQFNIQGDADEATINRVTMQSYNDFKQWMQRYENENKRLRFNN